MERLCQALALARRHQRQIGVLALDLDQFKRINDTLGHSAGNELLLAVARRLSEALRKSDTLGRRGRRRRRRARAGRPSRAWTGTSSAC